MSEANNNPNSFSSETNSKFMATNSQPKPKSSEKLVSNLQDDNQSEQKMNWQKVAHKLREYNRKLLKQVFRLEQELAEVKNRFNKYTERSQNSDVLVAQQESEIKNYQQQISLLTQHLTTYQQERERKEDAIYEISQQCKQSQQQAARLERDCTLLQESYSQNHYKLVTQEKENKELQTKLNQQQRYTLQYKSELKRYQEQAAIASNKPEISTHQNYTARSIQPWSTPSKSEPKIALPKTKSYSPTTQVAVKSLETVKTAAEIATWSASKVKDQQKATPSHTPRSNSGKPKSLAAVDLPTFPRRSV